MREILIRQATSSDYDPLGAVFFDAVRKGDSSYSESQLAAWAPAPRSGADWHQRLGSQTVFVAEKVNSLLGFMSLADGGYVDFAYILPEARGKGLFRLLYNEIESLARQNNCQRLWVHSSLTAQPAFSAVGFQITKEERVQVSGAWLDRFEMEKFMGVPSSK